MPALLIAVALAAAPAASADTAALAREQALWEAVRTRNIAGFKAALAPNYVGVYDIGVHGADAEARAIGQQSLRSFAIDDFKVRTIDADDMLVTYAVTVQGSAGKQDLSGRYWATTLWHRVGAKWLGVLHTEAKAQ